MSATEVITSTGFVTMKSFAFRAWCPISSAASATIRAFVSARSIRSWLGVRAAPAVWTITSEPATSARSVDQERRQFVPRAA